MAVGMSHHPYDAVPRQLHPTAVGRTHLHHLGGPGRDLCIGSGWSCCAARQHWDERTGHEGTAHNISACRHRSSLEIRFRPVPCRVLYGRAQVEVIANGRNVRWLGNGGLGAENACGTPPSQPPHKAARGAPRRLSSRHTGRAHPRRTRNYRAPARTLPRSRQMGSSSLDLARRRMLGVTPGRVSTAMRTVSLRGDRQRCARVPPRPAP